MLKQALKIGTLVLTGAALTYGVIATEKEKEELEANREFYEEQFENSPLEFHID